MTDQIETDDNSTWWKTPRFLISAVLVAMLIVLGVVLWLWPDGEEPTQAAPAPATTAEPVAGGESDVRSGRHRRHHAHEGARGRRMDRPGRDLRTVLGGARTGHRRRVNGCALLLLPHSGRGVAERRRTCWPPAMIPQLLLDTTQGAWHWTARARTSHRADPTAHRGERRSTTPVQIAGFRLLSYTGDKATVEVVAAADDGSEKTYITSSADMVWQDGDWRFVFRTTETQALLPARCQT